MCLEALYLSRVFILGTLCPRLMRGLNELPHGNRFYRTGHRCRSCERCHCVRVRSVRLDPLYRHVDASVLCSYASSC